MLLTNFDNKDLPKYKKAIVDFKAKTGSDRLYIEDVGSDCDGVLFIMLMLCTIEKVET